MCPAWVGIRIAAILLSKLMARRRTRGYDVKLVNEWSRLDVIILPEINERLE